jgi:peroxiredoxin Q/BCP
LTIIPRARIVKKLDDTTSSSRRELAMKDELRAGIPAPDFDLEGLDGKRLRLSDLRGKRVLVSLLRNAKCAVCNLWVHETAKVAADWRARGLEVVAVFESSAATLRTQFAGREPPFAVLADPDGRVHELFGSYDDPQRIQEIMASGVGEPALRRAAAAGFAPAMEEGSNFARIPAEVLIDAHGRVGVVHTAASVVDHLEQEAIERFVEATP